MIAASAAPTFALAGGALTLIGALILSASFSTSYKQAKLDETANAVGTLVVSFGTAVTFLGAAGTLVANSYSGYTILWVTLGVMGVTLISLYSISRVRRRKVAEEDESEVEKQ